tara:strand:- start:3115 stop:3438 length:324 start_codon:yes stop_codon:yes gene_type:complete
MAKKQKQRQSDIGVLDKQKNKLEPPKKFQVIMHNDDYTPMEFVNALLQQIFHRSPAEASRITMTVHKGEKGVAGIYSREIAETKSRQANEVAQANGHPFLTEIEPTD